MPKNPKIVTGEIEDKTTEDGKSTAEASGDCSPSCYLTLEIMRRRELIAAARAAVVAGVHLEDLTSLRKLLHPDCVEIIIDYYWSKNGERPSLYTNRPWLQAARRCKKRSLLRHRRVL